MRQETTIEVKTCDFSEGLVAMVDELSEAYPEERELGLTRVSMKPNLWGYVETGVGVFIVNEHAELVWLHLVNHVKVPIFPEYNHEGFVTDPKWNLDIHQKIFIQNQSGEMNLAEFIVAGNMYDERYENIRHILEAAMVAESTLDIENEFKRLKDTSFWTPSLK